MCMLMNTLTVSSEQGRGAPGEVGNERWGWGGE